MDRTGQSNTDGKVVAYPKDMEAENAQLEREVARLEAGTNNIELPPDFGKDGSDIDVEGMFGAMAMGSLKAVNTRLRAQLAEQTALRKAAEDDWLIAQEECHKAVKEREVLKRQLAEAEAKVERMRKALKELQEICPHYIPGGRIKAKRECIDCWLAIWDEVFKEAKNE